MPEELRLYYYEKDTEKKAYDLPIANYNDYTSPSSDFSYDTVPIYNDKFENVGTLARVLTLPYIKDINFGQYCHNFIIGDNNDTITVIFNYVVKNNSRFFPGGIPIPFTYLYGSGKYFNRKITGYLLPYDNEPKSREYVFYIE